jgi:hypothetical protein
MSLVASHLITRDRASRRRLIPVCFISHIARLAPFPAVFDPRSHSSGREVMYVCLHVSVAAGSVSKCSKEHIRFSSRPYIFWQVQHLDSQQSTYT